MLADGQPSSWDMRSGLSWGMHWPLLEAGTFTLRFKGGRRGQTVKEWVEQHSRWREQHCTPAWREMVFNFFSGTDIQLATRSICPGLPHIWPPPPTHSCPACHFPPGSVKCLLSDLQALPSPPIQSVPHSSHWRQKSLPSLASV